MRERFSGSMISGSTILAVMAASGAVMLGPIDPAGAQAPVASAAAPAPALTTPWGEPDLQGIWTDESDTPLQRPAQIREPGILHRGAARRIGPRARRTYYGRDKRAERGTELDVAGAYNYACSCPSSAPARARR